MLLYMMANSKNISRSSVYCIATVTRRFEFCGFTHSSFGTPFNTHRSLERCKSMLENSRTGNISERMAPVLRDQKYKDKALGFDRSHEANQILDSLL